MAGRLILSMSAAVLLVMGAAGLFAAHEAAVWLGAPDSASTALIVQTAAAAMLGLSFMNWFSRKLPIGGIYGRPLGVANLLLFAASALSIGKALAARQLPPTWAPIAAATICLALAFAWLVFAHDPLARAAEAERG